MPPMPDPAVVRVLREYRQAMDLKEAALMADMATRWLEIENRLNADISLLAREMADRAATGTVITEQMIWRQERYQIIKAQLEDEIKRYNQAYAVAKIERAQEEYALLGINAAQGAITASYGAFGRYWTRINLGAVQAMIGFAGDGSPLYNLLQNDYPDAVGGLLQALINGLARGMGPGQIASDMANGMGMGLERALLIARTEAARAYKAGSIEQYRQSEVVTGFRRLVKKETACMSCLLLDGETFEMESELDDHPNGKCTAVPNVEGIKAPSWEFGAQWFRNLDPEEQASRMGPEKYALWQDGRFSLMDLAQKTHNDTWGDSPRVATIAELTN